MGLGGKFYLLFMKIHLYEMFILFSLQLQQKEEDEAWKVDEVAVTSSSEGSEEREMNFV